MMRFPARGLLLLLAGSVLPPAGAQPADSLKYVELVAPQATIDSDRIVVTEFFSYQCPHCFSFDPVLEHWVSELPDDVLFERVAISIGYRQWVPIARAFHTLQAMGEFDDLHHAVFRAIHVDGERFYDKESIVQWLQDQGVDAGEFSAAYDSFSVDVAAGRAERRSTAHRVDSVPALAIDGKYRVAIGDNGTVEYFERQLAGVSELIDKIRAARRDSR